MMVMAKGPFPILSSFRSQTAETRIITDGFYQPLSTNHRHTALASTWVLWVLLSDSSGISRSANQ